MNKIRPTFLRFAIGAILLTLSSCGNPVIFTTLYIPYGAHVSMHRSVGGTLFAEVSGKRCYIRRPGGALEQHTFRLNDEVADSTHFDPKNRIVLFLYDEFGIRPGESYDYVLSMSQQGITVEQFQFRIDNRKGNAPIHSYQFVIRNSADPASPNSEGSFTKPDRSVNGAYVLTTTNAQGRPLQAELYFPIVNSSDVFSLCPLSATELRH